jgi:3-deoxy-D-manno-octulosonate 8-phosphate phosphatase (KDO 8-P phosphatase)
MQGLNFKQRLLTVKALVFDMDGVFTDGAILLMDNGESGRFMNTRDGHAIQQAVKNGLIVAIITGGHSESIRQRFRLFGVTDVYLRAHDKADSLDDLLAAYTLDAEHVLYMGDDFPDLPVLTRVGVPTCPADASRDVLDHCIYISPYKGGEGCVRDVIEQTLRVQGKWNVL